MQTEIKTSWNFGLHEIK